MMVVKKCNTCKQEKALDFFRNDERYKDGFLPKCNPCLSEYNKTWKEKNANNPNKPSELRLFGVSEKTKTELQNIADNIGIKFTIFMKLELRKIIDSYPPEKRLPVSNF